MQRMFVDLAVLRPPETLSSRIDPETRALLRDALTRVGLNEAAVESLRPWALATVLAVLELQKAGYGEGNGIDRLLLARARGSKAIIELESAEDQLRMMASIPEALQVDMLREQLRQGPFTAVRFAQFVTAWEAGNAQALAQSAFDHTDDSALAPFYEAMYWSRNRAMSDRLESLVGSPRTHLVVVGAGHVVGDRGIIALLAERGFRVRQLPRE